MESVECDGSPCSQTGSSPQTVIFGADFLAALLAATGLSTADLALSIQYETGKSDSASQPLAPLASPQVVVLH